MSTDQYKPSEHDGLTREGKPDKRMSHEHGFGGDKELASRAGKIGGQHHSMEWTKEHYGGDFVGHSDTSPSKGVDDFVKKGDELVGDTEQQATKEG